MPLLQTHGGHFLRWLKLVMFSFCYHCVRQALIPLSGNCRDHGQWCCYIRLHCLCLGFTKCQKPVLIQCSLIWTAEVGYSIVWNTPISVITRNKQPEPEQSGRFFLSFCSEQVKLEGLHQHCAAERQEFFFFLRDSVFNPPSWTNSFMVRCGVNNRPKDPEEISEHI